VSAANSFSFMKKSATGCWWKKKSFLAIQMQWFLGVFCCIPI
jgi:hypothetical protein